MIRAIVIGPTEHTKLCLEEILKTEGFKVEAVFGSDLSWKHRKARWTTFDDLSDRYGFQVVYCRRLRDSENIELIRKINPDVIFEFGSSEIIPKEILDIPKLGTIGSHGGPLPDVKGGASLNWALLRDEKRWGVSLYYLIEGVDEGDIIAVEYFGIDDRDNIKTLHDKSDYYTVKMLRCSLKDLNEEGNTTRIKQNRGTSIILPQRKPKDSEINWGSSSRQIFNLVRASTHPFFGAFTYLNNRVVYIWKASYVLVNNIDKSNEINGSIYNLDDKKGFYVKCSDGHLLIERVGFQDEAEMWADEFYKINGLKMGDLLGSNN